MERKEKRKRGGYVREKMRWERLKKCFVGKGRVCGIRARYGCCCWSMSIRKERSGWEGKDAMAGALTGTELLSWEKAVIRYNHRAPPILGSHPFAGWPCLSLCTFKVGQGEAVTQGPKPGDTAGGEVEGGEERLVMSGTNAKYFTWGQSKSEEGRPQRCSAYQDLLLQALHEQTASRAGEAGQDCRCPPVFVRLDLARTWYQGDPRGQQPRCVECSGRKAVGSSRMGPGEVTRPRVLSCFSSDLQGSTDGGARWR